MSIISSAFLNSKPVLAQTHGPLRWARGSNQQPLESPDDLEADFLEQQSIRCLQFFKFLPVGMVYPSGMHSLGP